MKDWMKLLLVCVLGVLACDVYAKKADEDEILYPGEAFSKLDTLEAAQLENGDKLYGKDDYTGAYAAYNAFSLTFSKSPALAYVLLRMGRCLHHVDKRFAAIRAYQDVVDYFPDDVRYAGSAMYYIGICHKENGDVQKQTAVWARMVRDDDYVTLPNSGTALLYLARLMDEMKKFDDAVEFHWRTAVNFFDSNRTAADGARQAVIYHYAVRKPNHEKLQEFFKKTNGYHRHRGAAVGNPEEDKEYWRTSLDMAIRAEENREDACRYWVQKLGDRFPEDDELRIKSINLQMVYEKDGKAWEGRMIEQFSRHPATLERATQWLGYFMDNPKLQQDFAGKNAVKRLAGAPTKALFGFLGSLHESLRSQYYAKYVREHVVALPRDEKVGVLGAIAGLGLGSQAEAVSRTVTFEGLGPVELRAFKSRFYHALYSIGLRDRAKQIFHSINTKGFTDAELKALVASGIGLKFLSEPEVLAFYDKMADRMFATNCRFEYFMSTKASEKALGEIQVLKKSTEYASQGLLWTEATILGGLGRYEEAIKAYQAANRQPATTWAVVECLLKLKRYGEAIQSLQGLESLKATAPVACLKIADVYKIAGNKGKEVEQLQLVLRRYPKSGQSSAAHQRLESYGVKLIGGISEAEE
ncbi:MAG: tetratricopeptide (TPR) repeat protein [Kiritimatiellia bacterium]|jgi:tetratricopeptide (TPR) repeat protein